MAPLLEIQNLEVCYGKARVVKGVSLQVSRGDCLAIVGANGAGKTSILRAVMGLVPAAGGRIILNGVDLTGRPAWERVTGGAGYVPEGRRVFPALSVEKNLLAGAYRVADQKKVHHSLARVYEIFPRLQERQRQPASTLSGGEQQMLAIGRALMAGPQLLIIDEVSMGLAPVVVNQAFQLIDRLHHEGLTVLLVEQNARKALQVAEWGYLLENGKIILSGRATDLRGHPDFVGAYFGRNVQVK
ncbi:ABC transporter ATP-binding protein [Desulfotomaculum copahuensis]|uniref:ABC transporter ATP-binding protein n=1 Tax=Desulfotomaculum copahuensis TaxID=1838280 RepID=UPI001FA6F2E0|nr:ABC transporter ATP-binding protein [Desulfotomaculum copahuensis]